MRLYLALYGTNKMENIIEMGTGGNECGIYVVISFLPAFSGKNSRSDLGSVAGSNF